MAFIQNLYNCEKLFSKTQELQYLFGLLKNALENRFSPGKIEYKYGIFASFETYELKDVQHAFFESHKEYVDFQLTLNNCEKFIIGDGSKFQLKEEFLEKDLITYTPKDIFMLSQIVSSRGDLCVFSSDDIHAGGIIAINSQNVQKVVFKVPKDLVKLKF